MERLGKQPQRHEAIDLLDSAGEISSPHSRLWEIDKPELNKNKIVTINVVLNMRYHLLQLQIIHVDILL